MSKIIIEADSLEELKAILEGMTASVKVKPQAAQLSRHIDSLPLDARTRNCLKAEEITTLGQLAHMSENDLQRIPNMGLKSAAVIRGVVAALLETP